MGCCLPNNRTNNLIISNIPKKDIPSTTQIFDNKNKHNSSPNNKGKKIMKILKIKMIIILMKVTMKIIIKD